tara:strand:+ start:27520 stop:29571 length:2052 start_codon:yes stop_codon:yes gene_type:complete
MDIVVVLSFIFFMTIFAGVGLASMRVKKDTTDDYLVAGRGMSPSLAALSAVSTWNSGYMFIGFIGFTYTMGYTVAFLAFMSTIGQFVAWIWLYKFIQKEGRERGVRSLSSLVADKAGAPEAKLAGILSVLFLSIYAAAQLTSGGKALFVMMGWSELVGILIGFVLVVAYCYAGGIRASIWTDAAQSCVMLVGSTILCWISLQEVGGFSGLEIGLNEQDPLLTDFLPPDLMFGFTLWTAAFFLGGLSVAGQPQVVSRVMTLGTDEDRKKAMIWFFVWQTPFIILMLIIGLASRVLFTESSFDAELGLPMMAMETMPSIGVGMILASIFAATMSTADSQVLACTAAITDDIRPEWRQDHKTAKKVTIVVAAFATLISIGGLYIPGGDSVFLLVVFAVYGLGGVFVPLLIIRWLGYKPDSAHSISMMTAAFSGVLIWTVLGFGDANGVFPSVPGMGAAFITHFSLNYFRTPHLSSLGRFNWPKRSQYGAIAAAIIIPFGAAEASYLVYAPDSSDNSDGMKTYIAQIDIQSEEPLLLESGSFGEGQALTFDVVQDSAGVDLKERKNITGITFIFDFESPSIADQSEPTVSIRITNGSEGNEIYTDTQTSFEHEWSYYHEINDLAGNITMSADSEENFRFQLEVDGEYIFIEVIYEDSNAILPVEDDSLDYDVLIFLETWNIDDITES